MKKYSGLMLLSFLLFHSKAFSHGSEEHNHGKMSSKKEKVEA